jgi:cardiolipin synthase
MLVDDRTSVVGTHNFDNRSFRLNFEVASVIVDEAFAREMQAMLERDFEHAEAIDTDQWDERPLWWRAAVRLSRLAAPVL